jgi:dTDP-4-amino-4,6-dideoxygalactose transaminase
MLAAFLLAQLQEREKIQGIRRRVWETYRNELSVWARDYGARLPIIPDYCEQPYHMFYLLTPSLDARQSLINHLKSQGVLSVFHYLPLHLSPMGRKFGGRGGDHPVTEQVSDRLVRLPFHNSLSPEDQRKILDAIHSHRVPDR